MFHTDYCIEAQPGHIGECGVTVGAIVANLQNSEGRIMNLKGRNFLTLKDFTPEEIKRRMVCLWIIIKERMWR